MNRIRTFGLAFLLAIVATGCATFDDEHEDHWRTLTILAVVGRAELSPEVNSRCVDSRPANVGDKVAVVQYRAGRSLHRQAFLLPEATQAAVGDRVAVNPRSCQVR